MNTPESHNDMIFNLIRRGLPADYARRAAAELADHHRDLIDELEATGLSESQAASEASRRLGNSRTLVKKTVREYQRQYWCGRWPLITFLPGPIPLLFLTWVTTWLVLLCVGWPLYKLNIVGDHQPDGTIFTGEYVVNLLAVAVLGFATPAVALVALARLAKRAAVDRRWLAVSACVLGLTAGMVRCGFPEEPLNPTTIDGKPLLADQQLLTLGVPLFAPSWLAAWKWYTRDLLQICQVLLPIVFVVAISLRARQLAIRSQPLVLDRC